MGKKGQKKPVDKMNRLKEDKRYLKSLTKMMNKEDDKQVAERVNKQVKQALSFLDGRSSFWSLSTLFLGALFR